MSRAEMQHIIAAAIRKAPSNATPEYVAQQAAGDLCTAMAVDALRLLLPSERRELLS